MIQGLLRRDFHVLRTTITSTLIDSSVLVFFTYILYAQLLPGVGMSLESIGPIFCGVIMLLMINVSYDRVMRDGVDNTMHKLLEYHAILPLSIEQISFKYLISYCCDILLATGPVILGARILYGALLPLPLSRLLFFVGAYMVVIATIAACFFGLMISASFEWLRENAWPWLLIPINMLGCYYYPWHGAYAISPWAGFICLLSPGTWCVELLRAGAFGNTGYIPVFYTIPLCALLGVWAYRQGVNKLRARYGVYTHRVSS